jgi:hypothetical protein
MHLCIFSASYLNATTQAGKKREHRRKSAPAICPARCMIEMERTSNGAARHALLVKFNSTKVQTLTPAPPAHAQHTGVYATPKNKTVSGVQRGLSQVCLSCAPSPRVMLLQYCVCFRMLTYADVCWRMPQVSLKCACPVHPLRVVMLLQYCAYYARYGRPGGDHAHSYGRPKCRRC